MRDSGVGAIWRLLLARTCGSCCSFVAIAWCASRTALWECAWYLFLVLAWCVFCDSSRCGCICWIGAAGRSVHHLSVQCGGVCACACTQTVCVRGHCRQWLSLLAPHAPLQVLNDMRAAVLAISKFHRPWSCPIPLQLRWQIVVH